MKTYHQVFFRNYNQPERNKISPENIAHNFIILITIKDLYCFHGKRFNENQRLIRPL